MTRKQFEGNFDQILRMLREHSFLMYSPAGRAEYNSKVASAYDHFRGLVYAASRISLPEDSFAVEDFDAVRQPTVHEAIRILARGASRTAVEGKASASLTFMNAADALRALR